MRSESDTNRTLMFRFVGTTGWLPGITATQLLGRPPDTWSTRSVLTGCIWLHLGCFSSRNCAKRLGRAASRVFGCFWESTSPMIAALMGRSRKRPLRKDWESVKDSIMHGAVLAKFTQHAMRETSLGTGNATDRRTHREGPLLGRRRRQRHEPAGQISCGPEGASTWPHTGGQSG